MTFHSAVQEGSAYDGIRDSRDNQLPSLLHSPHFADLLRIKRATVIPLLVVSIGFFICLALMAGFARPLLMMKVAGSLNLGFLLILVGYGICWIAALLYIVAANRLFDEKVAIVIRARLNGEKRP